MDLSGGGNAETAAVAMKRALSSLRRPLQDVRLRLVAEIYEIRHRGILLLGSGGVVHNLRLARLDRADGPIDEWARRFDDWVREKIERRYSTALGQAELASTSVEGRMLEVKKATLNMAGQSRLEEIRASLGQSTGTSSASRPAAAVETNQHPAIDDAPPPIDEEGRRGERDAVP